ncbi:MAG: tetratricopeptide repeat protein [Deltaproteobacteria bacterium]|nr:tetratricopeptide repeat protein [Deltaproteobacteria bacterium]
MTRAYPWFLVVAVIAAWANTLRGPFVYDDLIEIVANPAVHDVSRLDTIWAYNPARALLLFTYALNWTLGHLDPLGYHALNIAIHAANAVLAWRFFDLVLSPGRARLGAALWALHPMATEGVSYISGRSDALVTLFALLALHAWVVDARSPSRRHRALAYAAMLAGFFTKETAVVTPVLALLAELALVAGWNRRLLDPRRYLPVALAVAAGVAARLWLGGWPVPEVPRTLLAHVLTQAEVWARYLQLWILPLGQSILQPVPAEVSRLGGLCLLAWLVAAGLAVYKRGIWALLAGWWALPLAISSAFVLKETMAEHRAYAAGLAVAALVAWKLPERRVAWALPAILLVATVVRNQSWTSEVATWESAVKRWPGNADAWYAYGDALRAEKLRGEAESAYAKSLELDPARVDALVNAGIARAEGGDIPGAREAWEEALRRKPGHCPALNNLAALRLRSGDVQGAIAGYEATLRTCADDPMAHFNLGMVWAGAGTPEKAATHLRAYLRVDPGGANEARARAALRRLGVSD